MNGKKRNKERDTRINFASIYKLLHVTLHLHLKILRNYLLASYFSSRGDTSENCHPRRVSRTALLNPSSKNIRYIRLCSLVFSIKHAVRFSTGGKDSHRLISAQFALLAFELFATRARRFFIVAVEKESKEQQRRGKEKKKTRRRRRRRRRRGVLLFSSRALLLFKIPTPSSQRLRARELERDGGPRME